LVKNASAFHVCGAYSHYMRARFGGNSLLFGTAVIYFLFLNYFDHGQPIVASTSLLWMHGHDLYPNWETAELYGLAYGPMLFLLWDSFTYKSNNFYVKADWCFVFKCSGFKEKARGTMTSIFLLATLVMLSVPFGIHRYWNRPEPFLIVISVLTLAVAVISARRRACQITSAAAMKTWIIVAFPGLRLSLAADAQADCSPAGTGR